MKFELTYRDEIEAENQDEAVEWLLQYLFDCVKNEDVSAFQLFKLEDKEV